jgi:hypothetical protein
VDVLQDGRLHKEGRATVTVNPFKRYFNWHQSYK